MTNKNSPIGGKPIENLITSEYTGKVNKYIIPATELNDIFVNDFVKLLGTSDSDGIAYIGKASPGEKIVGIIVAVKAGFEKEELTYRQAGIETLAYVMDDPFIQIEIQVNGTITASDIKKCADIILGGGDTTYGISKTQLDLSTLTTGSAQIKILGRVERDNNDFGLYTKVRCLIAEHEYKDIPTFEENLWDLSGADITPHTPTNNLNMGTSSISGGDGNFTGDVDIDGKLTVGGLIDPTGIILSPQSSTPATDNGTIYYNSSTNKFNFRENGSWSILEDNIWDTGTGSPYPVTDIIPQNAGNNLNMTTGGFKDIYVTTAITLGDTGNTSLDGSLGPTNSLLDAINQVITSQYDENLTGFVSWGGSGAYYTFVGNTFTLLRSGTGRILGQTRTWTAPQSVTVDDNTTAYIAINSAGTLIKINYGSLTDTAYYTNIFLFEALYTGATNNVNICVKENHPYDYQQTISRYEHNNLGVLIRKGFGVNITKIGVGNGGVAADRQIKIVGSGYLDDHGLSTLISDTGSSPISISQMYKSATNYWYSIAAGTELLNYYNSAGTPTLANNGRFTAHVVYATKDNLNSSSPIFYSVMHTADFGSAGAAQTAITNQTITFATNELDALELARLGYVIMGRSGGNSYINSITISKSVPGSATIVGAGTATSHLLLSDLNTGDAGHTQFALLAGRTGGQTFYGSDTNSENLTLASTSAVTKGLINFGLAGTSFFNETTNTLTLSNLTASSLLGADASKQVVTITDLPNGTTATTQSAGDSSTKVATTAYVDSAIGGENLWDRSSTFLSTHTANDSIQLGSTAAVYLGANDTNGTWRIVRSGDDLSFERRESGSYVSKGKILATA